MSTITNWFSSNWQELATFIGIGGGSGILGKKLTDRRQSRDIKANKAAIKRISEEQARSAARHARLAKEVAELKGSIQSNNY